MATERIVIVVEERGTRRVKMGFREIGAEAKTSSSSVDFLKRAIVGLGAAATIRSVLRLADSFTAITNRIRIANDGVGDVASTFERLRDISNQTRTPLEANVQLFQRAAIAGDELGASQEELFRLVTLVGQGLAIQGGAASESTGALLQLSQALGSGIVRAEEFNSILEGAFPLALAAARGLDEAGGSVARLRTLVIEGRVTSDAFFRALLSQADELDSTFRTTVPTVGQAFTVLRNNLVSFVGEVNSSIGATDALAETIIALSNNLDSLVSTLLVLGPVLLAVRFSGFAQAAVAATIASLQFQRQVASGSVVLLGSAQAERQRALASAEGARADVLKTQTALANARAEIERAIVVRGSTTAIFAQAAAQKQLAAIEATLVTQKNALTAAELRLATATRTAAVQQSLLGRAMIRTRAAVTALTAAIAANPVGILLVALTATVALLVVFSDEIRVANGELTTLRDVGISVFEEFGFIAKDALSAAIELVRGLAITFGASVDVINGDLRTLLRVGARIADGFVGLFVGAFFALGRTFQGLPGLVSSAVQGAINVSIAAIEGLINASINAINFLVRGAQNQINALIRDVNSIAALIPGVEGLVSEISLGEIDTVNLGRLENDFAATAKNFSDSIIGGFQEGFEQTTGVQDLLDRALERADIRAENREALRLLEEARANQPEPETGGAQGGGNVERSAALAVINRDLAEQERLLRLTNREREVATNLSQIEASLARQNITLGEQERFILEERLKNLQALEEQAQVLDEIRGPQEQLIARQEALDALFSKGRISAGEYAKGLLDIRKAALETDESLQGGFGRGLITIGETISDFSSQAEATIVNAFGAAEDAVVKFAQTGEISFSDFVDSLLADVTRLVFRQGLDLILGSFGGAGGAAGGLLSALGGRQIGGPVAANQPVVVGENGREIFQPSVPGNVIPAGPTQAALGSPQMNVTIVNQVDSSDVLDVLGTEEAGEVIFNRIERGKNRVNASLGQGAGR